MRGVLVFLVVCFLPGCGDKPVESVAVRGRVQQGGKGVPNVLVRFKAADPRAPLADQMTNQDGTFELKCLPGKYNVCLMVIPKKGEAADPTQIVAGPEKGQPLKIPPAYLDVSSSPWRDLDIPAGGKNDLVLEIKN